MINQQHLYLNISFLINKRIFNNIIKPQLVEEVIIDKPEDIIVRIIYIILADTKTSSPVRVLLKPPVAANKKMDYQTYKLMRNKK